MNKEIDVLKSVQNEFQRVSKELLQSNEINKELIIKNKEIEEKSFKETNLIEKLKVEITEKDEEITLLDQEVIKAESLMETMKKEQDFEILKINDDDGFFIN